ncbi:hypothetical protein L6Q96_10365 [Candidatus Binatia bacterium]|nr:hypothetical protein [Candidatus Binatia bacterium]
MEFVLVTLDLYRRVFTRAAELAGRNWAVLGSVFVYAIVSLVATDLAAFMGPLAGIFSMLVWAACASSFLYLVEMIVRTSRANFDDFRRSFGAYLWDVVGVAFILWLFFRLAAPAILQMPQGLLILVCVQLMLFVLLNAVPELIYLGHHSSLGLLKESYAFIATNWVEWFPANFAAAALLLIVAAVFPAAGPLAYAKAAVLGLLVYFVMVMRGLLFIELCDSTYRSRRFKYRAGG